MQIHLSPRHLTLTATIHSHVSAKVAHLEELSEEILAVHVVLFHDEKGNPEKAIHHRKNSPRPRPGPDIHTPKGLRRPTSTPPSTRCWTRLRSSCASARRGSRTRPSANCKSPPSGKSRAAEDCSQGLRRVEWWIRRKFHQQRDPAGAPEVSGIDSRIIDAGRYLWRASAAR